jgi:mannose-6-phosphate isomerase-like protein (cupin superfamily)
MQTHTDAVTRSSPVIDNPVTGERIVIRQSAGDTGGALLAFDLHLTAGGHVPASHVHPCQEERFTVVAGRLRFRRGLRTVVVGPGQTVAVAPGTIHRFANAGDEPAHAIVEVRAALRMEDLFRTTAALAREGRTLPGGMPRPLDLALFLQEFERELAIPVVPCGLVRSVIGPLAGVARRRGLGRRYRRPSRRVAA